MKKAIQITGIIWAIVCGISAIIFFAGGSLFAAAFAELMKQQGGVPEEEIKIAAAAMLAVYMVLGVYMLVAAIYSIVLVAVKNKQMSKGAGIAMAVVGIVLGAELPGVFFLIDSIKNR